MAVTRYYLRNTQTNGGTGGTVYDLLTAQGTGATLQSAAISGTSFTEVFRWQVGVPANVAPDTVIPVSVNISAVSASTLEVRWRIQRIDSSNVVQDSSGYSAAYNTTGTKTDNLSLSTTWNSGDRMALSMELRRVSGGGSRTVTISVNNANSFIDPDLVPVAQVLLPSLYTNNQTFYGSTVNPGAVTLLPVGYTNNQTFYDSTVTQSGGAQSLLPALYANNQTFYAASVAAEYFLQPTKYDSNQTFYDPTVTQVGGVQTLLPALYTNNQTFYAASVSADYSLLPARYDSGQTFYDPAVTTAYPVNPSFYSNAQTFYFPTVVAGAVDLSPSVFTNNQTFFNADVAQSTLLSPSLSVNQQIFYPPAVVVTVVDLQPELLVNSSVFFSPTVAEVVYTLTKAQALELYKVWLLHGLGQSPLVVNATTRSAGAIEQSVSQLGSTVTLTTVAAPTSFTADPGTMIEELSALHGLTADLVTTPTSRTAGTINQTFSSSGNTTTVTRQ